MKNRILYFIVFLVIGSTIVYLVKDSLKGEAHDAEGLDSYVLREFRYDFPFKLNSEGVRLDLSNLTLVNKKNQLLPIDSIVHSVPILVFRITPTSCSICVNREIGNINQLVGKVDKNKIVILTAYDNVRDYFIFLQYTQTEFPIYNIEQLDIIAEEAGNAYLFVLNHEHQVLNLFFPSKHDNTFSEIYYQEILPQLVRVYSSYQ